MFATLFTEHILKLYSALKVGHIDCIRSHRLINQPMGAVTGITKSNILILNAASAVR